MEEIELATKVATKLGLEISGNAYCTNDPECGQLEVDVHDQEQENPERWHIRKLWPVSVQHCMCEFEESKKDIQLFGHSTYCFEPVPDPYDADTLMTILKQLEHQYGWMALAKKFQNCRRQGEVPVEEVIVQVFIAEDE